MKAKDDEGTALDYASMNIKRMGAQALKLLEEKTGLSPTEELLVIVGKAKPDRVRQLIQDGADVNAKNKDGWTPLMAVAQHSSNPEVLTALIKAGADVNAKDTLGATPLMFAAIHKEALIKS
nr:ankyrin repeat domain-containing protein [uncultured Fretibacterium sp.]